MTPSTSSKARTSERYGTEQKRDDMLSRTKKTGIPWGGEKTRSGTQRGGGEVGRRGGGGQRRGNVGGCKDRSSTHEHTSNRHKKNKHAAKLKSQIVEKFESALLSSKGARTGEKNEVAREKKTKRHLLGKKEEKDPDIDKREQAKGTCKKIKGSSNMGLQTSPLPQTTAEEP